VRRATNTPTMLIGILCGLAAGALRGLSFIVPKLVPGWGAIELTIARYVVYGAVSLVALLLTERAALRRADARFWLRAVILGSLGYTIYYACVAVAVRLADVSLTTLIIGTLPVTITLTARLVGDRTPLSRLALPIVLVTGGLIAINADAFAIAGGGKAARDVALGALCALGGLVAWNLYALWNARTLKTGGISSTAWASFVGIGALGGSVGLIPLMLIEPVESSTAPAPALTFWIWVVITGIGSSWLATILWNIASKRLPVSLAGFLIVSETLFGLLYGFLLDGRAPRALEIAAIVLIVSGVAAATLAHRAREGGTSI
jgi:drug/metabolite transporter (DMT)-like permease